MLEVQRTVSQGVDWYKKCKENLLSLRHIGYYDIKYGEVVSSGDSFLDTKPTPKKEILYKADNAISTLYEYKTALRNEKRRVVSPSSTKPDRHTVLAALSDIYVYLAQSHNRKEIFEMINDDFDILAKNIRNLTSLTIEAVLVEAKRQRDSKTRSY